MRISAIQNCGTCCPTPKKNLNKQNYQTHHLKSESIKFNGRVAKGAGLGALFGVAGLGLISALSGGLATPIAFGVYAGMFGTLGGKLGKAIDDIEKEEKEEKKNNG